MVLGKMGAINRRSKEYGGDVSTKAASLQDTNIFELRLKANICIFPLQHCIYDFVYAVHQPNYEHRWSNERGVKTPNAFVTFMFSTTVVDTALIELFRWLSWNDVQIIFQS
jgi:hypothetical protein